MWRHKSRFFILAGVFLIGAIRSPSAQLAPGDLFPVLSKIVFDGELPFTNQEVLVVDFWASWCAPCKESFPSLSRLQTEFEKRGVMVLGVSVDQSPEQYAAFLKKFTPLFPVVRDHTHQLVSLVQVPVMPTTYLVGRDGKIRRIISGYHGMKTEQALRSAINRILKEQSAP